MSYNVQPQHPLTANTISYVHGGLSQVGPQGYPPNPTPGLYIQDVNLSFAASRSLVVMQGGSGGSGGSISRVKIKRPDGTWADVLRVTGVHLRLPDGTWEVFL